jgi:LmbE family N-acetylglucosaminyl deacetylase
VNRVLVIAPHPDDEVLGCGGALARHAASGDETHVVVVTRGAVDRYTDEQIQQIRKEAAAAHSRLGVSTTSYLEFPAPKLDQVPLCDLGDSLRRIVGSLRPHTVYLPHQGDIHGDHKAVYWAALVACRPIGVEYPRRLLCYETPSETEWGAPNAADAFVPTVFLDVSAYIHLKFAAMECYASQVTPSPGTRSLASIEALARFRGGTVGVAAAEAFSLVREVL